MRFLSNCDACDQGSYYGRRVSLTLVDLHIDLRVRNSLKRDALPPPDLKLPPDIERRTRCRCMVRSFFLIGVSLPSNQSLSVRLSFDHRRLAFHLIGT